jgi:hypothetical protein
MQQNIFDRLLFSDTIACSLMFDKDRNPFNLISNVVNPGLFEEPLEALSSAFSLPFSLLLSVVILCFRNFGT